MPNEDYEEKVINQVLHHKGKSTGGEWVPFTLEELTIAYKAMFYAHQREEQRANELQARVSAILKVLGKDG